ncbi:MAG: single-stranded DNA-binding protein [Simkania sp.]|nr:single-stranded DNA-binding protein [Simkania sp.]MCP5491200.1 single-stranded DNA-binding protein [Chlamydiales bacterium]
MNQLTIMGHLGADPEVRFTSSGQKVTTLRVAENQKRGGKDETLWWRITIWGEQFDKLVSYLKKGSAIIVTGEMSKPEIYNDRDGKPQISLNMTAYHIAFSPFGRTEKQPQEEPAMAGQSSGMSGFGGDQGQQHHYHKGGYDQSHMSQGQGPTSYNEPSDDEIPF